MTERATDQLAAGLAAQGADDLPLHMRRVGLDPAPELTTAREQDGVVQVTTPFGTSAWLITRYADIRMVLGDAERFSNASLMRIGARARGEDEEAAKAAGAGNLRGYDPPEHTRLRRMLTPEFTMRRMRHLQPRIERIVTDHLDAMEQAGSPAGSPTSPCLSRRWSSASCSASPGRTGRTSSGAATSSSTPRCRSNSGRHCGASHRRTCAASSSGAGPSRART